MKTIATIIMVIILLGITSISCKNEVREAIPFTIEVKPTVIENAYPGQAYEFLVTALSDETERAIKITASMQGASLEISTEEIKPGETARIVAYPSDESVNQTLLLVVEGERDGLLEKETATIYMGSGS